MFRSIIHNSQKVKKTQMYVSGRKAKQNVAYSYSGLLLNFKKERDSDPCYNIDVVLSEISWSQKDKHCMIPLR